MGTGTAYGFFDYKTDAPFERLARGMQTLATELSPDGNSEGLELQLLNVGDFAPPSDFLRNRKEESLAKRIPLAVIARRKGSTNKVTADRLAETFSALYGGSPHYKKGDPFTAHIYYVDNGRYVERE